MTFKAYLINQEDGKVVSRFVDMNEDQLDPGEVTIRVGWSSVNYKDGLATIPNGKVARISPLIPGIDMAGTVIASDDPAIGVGDEVIAHGYDLGVARHGGRLHPIFP